MGHRTPHPGENAWLNREKLGKIANLIIVSSTYLFLYVPIVVLLVFSFNSEGFPSPWKEFTWKWYIELFNSEPLWDAFYNSLIVATSSTFISLTMGVFLIFYAAQGGRIGKFLNLFYGNIIVPRNSARRQFARLFWFGGDPFGAHYIDPSAYRPGFGPCHSHLLC